MKIDIEKFVFADGSCAFQCTPHNYRIKPFQIPCKKGDIWDLFWAGLVRDHIEDNYNLPRNNVICLFKGEKK